MAVQPSRLGPWVAPVMGMTFAFGWTPCITPVLAAVLGLASSGGTLARGEEMLVAYSLGLGVPFVVTGLAFGRLSGALRFARRHSRAVSLVSGLVLATLGVLIITGRSRDDLFLVVKLPAAHRAWRSGHRLSLAGTVPPIEAPFGARPGRLARVERPLW